MEPGDGYQGDYLTLVTNHFSNIQIIARKRRRSAGDMKQNSSPEQNHNQNPSYYHNHNDRSLLSGSWNSFSCSSSLVVLLFSLLFVLCVVPETSCLPYGDGGHRSQLDLLIDPIHQAEYDDTPLENKRIVAKSVFDMVLRTPPPPTTSSSRCPPGTQSPFEGGPCIKKSTEPVATVDEVFLLDTLRGLAEKGVLLQSSSRPKRPGGGRRRPSGRPGSYSRPRTTTQEPSSTTTTPFPATTIDEETNEVPTASTVFSADEQIALTTGPPASASVVTEITAQKMSSTSSPSPTEQVSLPEEATTTTTNTVVDTVFLPEQEKSGQVYLDNSEPITTSQRMTANSDINMNSASQVIDKDQISPESVTDGKQPENLETTLPSSSPSVRPTFTEEELTVDVITKDGTDKDKRGVSASTATTITPPVTITPSPSASLGMMTVLTQVAEGDDVTVDKMNIPLDNEMERITTATSVANKDDIILTNPTVSPIPIALSQNQGDTSEAISTVVPEEEDTQASLMSTRIIRFDEKKNGDQAWEKRNENPGGHYEGTLILDGKVTAPSLLKLSSKQSESQSPEESKRDEEEKRVLVLLTKEDEPKRPLKPETKTEAGLVSSSSSANDYEIVVPEEQVPQHKSLEAETTTTTTVDVNMTGGNTEEGTLLPHEDRDQNDQRNVVIEKEGDDRLPSLETSPTTTPAAVNHFGLVNGETVMPVKHENSDLLIINNQQTIPLVNAEVEDGLSEKKDGGDVDPTSPNSIVEETSPSSREETSGEPEKIEDFTIAPARGDQPVLNEKDVDPDSMPKVPATTLLPPTTMPSSPSAFKDDNNSGSLLQFQLPIVTRGPPSSSGFEKFPEFPPVPLPSHHEISGKIRFPSGEENLVPIPAEGSPSNNGNRGTIRPVIVEDFDVDFPPREETHHQEWQSPKPFPHQQQQSSSPSPIPNNPIQIQTTQPEFYDTGSTEYLESELDRRHQKTRSRNRIRYPDAVTTNSPLPPELVFYSPSNHNLQLRQQQPQSSQQHQQPIFFARRNPSSEFFPFGYLNFRSGSGFQDRFNSFNRRLFR